MCGWYNEYVAAGDVSMMGNEVFRMSRRTVITVVLAPIFAVLLSACPPRLSRNVERITDLVYGAGYISDGAGKGFVLRDLPFDLLQPKDSEAVSRPGLVLVHGGSFEGGSRKDEDLVQFADSFASRGYVCFLIDYRLIGDRPPAPEPYIGNALESAVHAAFVDTKVALRFVRAHAAEYRVDPNRIAVFGESAGAFAAIAAGVSGETDYASDGPDLPVPEENNPGVAARPIAVIDFWGSAAPVLDLFDPGDPPIMIVHGTNDFTLGTFYTEALAIVNACEEQDIPCRLHTLLGEGHGAWDAEWGDRDLATLALEFLAEYMP